MAYVEIRRGHSDHLHVVDVRSRASQNFPSLTLHIEPVIHTVNGEERVRDIKILLIPCHEDDAPFVGFRIEG